ncbi:MAG: HU family DNA-binding protein [Deltaproteobacteria bacterium]|nr:HU family DNA-binding protein [Deltaproteobacteria bacterium]
MNKSELVEAVATKSGLTPADAEKAVNAFIDVIVGALKGGDGVTISGFGAFSAAKRAERTGRNPRTGEEIKIAASTVPKFKPAKGFKDAVS